MAHTRWVERTLHDWVDDPDLLPLGTPNAEHPFVLAVPDLSTPVQDLTLDQLRDRVRYLEIQAHKTNTHADELERMYTHPHLYDDWQIDLAKELAQIEHERYLTQRGLIEWPCGQCDTWQVSKEADGSSTPCYVCGA